MSKEFIDKKVNTAQWQEAYDWMISTDSISTSEISRKWRSNVDRAFTPTKRKISLGMVFKVLFSRPYNPIKYLYRKDNDYVSDLFWKQEEFETSFDSMVIHYPVLLITGRYDDIAPPEEMAKAHQILPNSQLLVIPNAAHESFLDQPELFQAAVLEFLNIEID